MHLDLTHLGEQTIDKKLPFVRELSRIYAGVDPVREPIPVRPVVHYMMGGVDTDIDGATELPGLYAAGETACVSLNGANRLGSNSLTECLVFGARAGREAVRFAAGSDAGGESACARPGRGGDRAPRRRRAAQRGGEKLAQLRRDLNQTMEEGCGVYREQASMDTTVRTVAQLKERMSDVRLEDSSRVFNTELIAALELDNMLDVAESLAVSAAHRNESRGAHTRRDSPKRNDENFLYHSLCYCGRRRTAARQEGRHPGHLGFRRSASTSDDREQTKTFVVTRFDPDRDEAPRQQSYEVPVQPDWKVLDALNFIKDEIDGTLSHRWSCRMAVCGSCGMMVNGEPSLTCKDAVSDYGDRVEVAPLANFPIVRDLVVELDGFMEKLRSVKPWIIARQGARGRGGHLSPVARGARRLQAVQHVHQLHALLRGVPRGRRTSPSSSGPPRSRSAIATTWTRATRASRERNEVFRGEGNVFACSYANECSEVCPKHVDPAAAVNQSEAQRGDRLGHGLRRAARRPLVVPRAAHPDAMQPHRPGRTRTAPPQMPPQFPLSGRYLTYMLFGCTGVLYLLAGFVALRAVWALGSGPSAWQGVQNDFENPLYVLFHALALAAVIFVGVRFFRLFPKAQPAQDRAGEAAAAADPARRALRGLRGVSALALVLAGGLC